MQIEEIIRICIYQDSDHIKYYFLRLQTDVLD